MGKRLTYEFVKEQFEKEGYELLSGEYVDSKTKLKYRCPKGHEHSIKWANWQQGQRCPYCAGNGKLTIEFIRSEFAKERYKLLTTDYENCSQKLYYVCPNGHERSINWNNWQQGGRCPCQSNHMKPTIEFIRSEFVKEGYKLLTKKYVSNQQKLDYICPRGHKGSISWGNWIEGRRCPCQSNLMKPTIRFIRSEFTKEDYILLTTKYKNSRQKLEYICPNGHKHNISWNSFRAGERCPYCVGMVSKGEVEVRNFIESFGIKVSANDRNQIFNPFTNYGLELDIFMPDLDKAIEYNGEYWHQDKDRDLVKQQLCESKNISLLTVWDKEWSMDIDKCKIKIKRFVMEV